MRDIIDDLPKRVYRGATTGSEGSVNPDFPPEYYVVYLKSYHGTNIYDVGGVSSQACLLSTCFILSCAIYITGLQGACMYRFVWTSSSLKSRWVVVVHATRHANKDIRAYAENVSPDQLAHPHSLILELLCPLISQ